MNYSDFVDYMSITVKSAIENYKAKYFDAYDLYDVACELVDGDPLVIYTSKSWDLVAMFRTTSYDQYKDAASEAEDTAGPNATLDELVTATAYYLVLNYLLDTLNKEIQNVQQSYP